MANKKNEASDIFNKVAAVYFLKGSSPFHNFEGLDQFCYSFLKMNNNNLNIEFFFEFQCPKCADLMMNFTAGLKKNKHFYKDHDFVEQMIVDAYSLSVYSFQQVCSKLDIALPDMEASDEFVISMINSLNQEAPAYIANQNPMFDSAVFEFPEGGSRNKLLRDTMLVLDPVFLNSKSTDRMHNRRVLEENTGMTFTEFLAIRQLSIKETQGKIGFNPMESVRLFQLQDCAAQMLAGTMYDKIAKDLENQSWKSEFQTQYLLEVENFNKQCRSMIKKFTGDAFPSLVPFHDWDKVFR